MTWPKTGATHYRAQLGLLRQRSCNQRVSCLMGKWTLYTTIIGLRAVTEAQTNCQRPMVPLLKPCYFFLNVTFESIILSYTFIFLPFHMSLSLHHCQAYDYNFYK